MSSPAPQTGRYTYADYRRWREDERWELIDGVAYDMTPAPSRTHQDVLGARHVQVRPHLAGGPCRVYLAPFEVRLPRLAESDDEVDTLVQPDLSVICDPAKLDDAGCRGAPDWVVEVLSPWTAAKDHV
jgi:Uma2 family endonuclease